MTEYNPFETAESTTEYLIDGAAEKVQWARHMAKEFLDYAASLREKADSFTHLAGIMIVEAQSHADDITSLINAEFPFSDDVEDMKGENDAA